MRERQKVQEMLREVAGLRGPHLTDT
jgi:hypothetical protein